MVHFIGPRRLCNDDARTDARAALKITHCRSRRRIEEEELMCV